MFDLLDTARASIVVGAGGFGIKKLERYYNPHTETKAEGALAFSRDTETTDGASSMLQYQSYLEAIAVADNLKAQAILDDIIEYNRGDCVSTLKLYNWLDSLG
jgi:uncharacterized protein